MHKVAFHMGPFLIHWYAILIVMAIIIGFWLTRNNARRYGMDVDTVDGILLKLVIVVMVGARVAFVISKFPFYMAHPEEIIRVDHGGLGSHGAIIAGLTGIYFWSRKAGISFLSLGDAIAPAITIAHVFVRIGNFLNGELYGPPTNLPWAVKFPATPVPVHPSQLYEVITSLILLPFALQWSKAPPYPGYALLRVLLAHSVIRFFMDFFRQDAPLSDHLVLTQIVALVFILASGGYIWYLERKGMRRSKLR